MEDILSIVVEYFTDLINTSTRVRELTTREHVSRVGEEHNTQLMIPVTMEEVKITILLMHPEKSPRIDGLNPGLYQVYWQII